MANDKAVPATNVVTFEIDKAKLAAVLASWNCKTIVELTARMKLECMRPARDRELTACVADMEAKLNKDWGIG